MIVGWECLLQNSGYFIPHLILIFHSIKAPLQFTKMPDQILPLRYGLIRPKLSQGLFHILNGWIGFYPNTHDLNGFTKNKFNTILKVMNRLKSGAADS
jgi:hypothetical protein